MVMAFETRGIFLGCWEILHCETEYSEIADLCNEYCRFLVPSVSIYLGGSIFEIRTVFGEHIIRV
jgi:hypothetical protein